MTILFCNFTTFSAPFSERAKHDVVNKLNNRSMKEGLNTEELKEAALELRRQLEHERYTWHLFRPRFRKWVQVVTTPTTVYHPEPVNSQLSNSQGAASTWTQEEIGLSAFNLS